MTTIDEQDILERLAPDLELLHLEIPDATVEELEWGLRLLQQDAPAELLKLRPLQRVIEAITRTIKEKAH